ncbi:glycoside hydrolase superfamily [Cladochytrium replicatum]|nr:glycoside hydrolase superfamily [Cladochytrium replicatum]
MSTPSIPAPVPTKHDSLLISGRNFVDAASHRTVLLRGVNLSGNGKLPYTPRQPAHEAEGFFDDTNVSFVGRPFPLDEADEHLSRLKHWGYNFLRLVFTWEALEHAGPGIYDYEFMDYLIEVLYKLKAHGFKCFLDPHQDVWSRFTGGSGAPGWTLRAVGLNAAHFAATGAAVVQNTWREPQAFPKMVWATNYFKLAAGTMFTLFFAGETYAPNHYVATLEKGASASSDKPPKPKMVQIQEFLQSHYINAIAELAKRIHQRAAELEDSVVVGYDTLNEPNEAFLETPDIHKTAHYQELKNGDTPTILQGMQLGEGRAAEIEVWDMAWDGPFYSHKRTINPGGIKAWYPQRLASHLGYPKKWDQDPAWVQEGGCIWANHGVWDRTTGKALKPDHFHKHKDGKPAHYDDFFIPFVERFTVAIRKHHPTAVIFVEPAANSIAPKIRRTWLEKAGKKYEGVPVSNDGSWDRICFAPHFYDSLTLINKTFNTLFAPDLFGDKRKKYSNVFLSVKFFEKGIKGCFRDQLGGLQDEGEEHIGEFPCLIGEIGIPMDLDGKGAYKTGDYSKQIVALDAHISGLEANPGLHYTLWNYCPDNSNTWGDGWNGEDLSIFSRDTVLAKIHDRPGALTPLDKGGRAMESFVRPAPIMVPGTLHLTAFDLKSDTFILVFKHPSIDSLRNGSSSAKFAYGWDKAGSNKADKVPVVELGKCTHDVEIYLPRLHFSKLEEIEVYAGSVPGSALDSPGSSALETSSWKVDVDAQRFWYRCPCARHSVARTPLDGADTSAQEPIAVDEVEHRIVIRGRKLAPLPGPPEAPDVTFEPKTLVQVAKEEAVKAEKYENSRKVPVMSRTASCSIM